MTIHWIDWALIAAFIILSLWISLRNRQTASSGLKGFFLGGGKLPWILTGVSMVATTFAADTPLAVTELVAEEGIAGNWVWWNLLIGGLLTTVFFAKLWRRAGILTEVEFIHLRYSGPAARFLRKFKAVYLGLFFNALIIGWVNLAFMALIQVFLDVNPSQALWISAGVMAFVAVYSAISGLKGIVWTDSVQFVLAMAGCIILAVVVVNSKEVGGTAALVEKLPKGAVSFFPKFTAGSGMTTIGLTVSSFFAYVGLLWWTTWYPGAEPGGGGYIAQRMMASKDEAGSVKATLLFQVAHYCLRPWPWIVVGLCAMVIYPDLAADEKKLGFVLAIKDYMPVGLKGLLLVAFLGAYMSTISTQLNWGASYLVNDLLIPMSQSKSSNNNLPDESALEEEQDGEIEGWPREKVVAASRWATIVIMVIGIIASSQFDKVNEVWKFIMQCGAGLGVVLIFRWFWWRINAWTEIVATIVPFLTYGGLKILQAGVADQPPEMTRDLWYFDFGYGVMLSVGLTIIASLITIFITKPTEDRVLSKFFTKVRPMGSWGRFGKSDNKSVPWLIAAWLTAVVMVYACLFFMGELIFFGWVADTFYYLLAMALALIAFSYTARKGQLFSWHGN